MALYRRIRDLREDSDKTQAEVAEYLGTTAQYYGKYENGEREIPFLRAIQLAKYYDVSLDYLADLSTQKQSGGLSADERHLLSDWALLSERNRGKVEFLIETLLEQQMREKESQ